MLSAVIGDPAGHSLSPAIHRAGYRLNSLDWEYRAVTVPPEDLEAFVREAASDPRWAGLSVTAPHKEEILHFGEPDHVSTLTRAGNTLLLGERPRVFNTDVPGFVRAWRHRCTHLPRSAVIVGAGATARSILVALAGLELRRVTVLARNRERARPLLDLAVALGIDARCQPLDFVPEDVDLLASTVPAPATAPHAQAWASSANTVFDVVYDPWPTPLAAEVGEGQQLLTGLDLLAGQAVDQFHLLTGGAITFEQAYEAARKALTTRT